MKVEIKKDGLKREIKFEIPKDRVSQALSAVYEDIGKVSKIKGFRPGKAPRHMLEKQHGKLAEEEALKKLIPEVYREAIEKEKIDPLDLPEIEDVLFKDGMVRFTAKLDVRPEIKLKEYKGIKVTRKGSVVTDEEINKTLDFFKKGQGDKEVTIDDAFAHGVGYANLEDFKNSLKRQMEIDKDRQNRSDVENQIVEELLKQVKFEVPQTLVSRQIERRLQEARRHWQSQHKQMTKEEMDKKETELRKDLVPAVEKDIKVYLIFDKIAEAEDMKFDEPGHMPGKVMEFLLKEAAWENN